MALFKISKGKSTNLPANKVNGYCYVTTDEHKLYVDYTKDDGTLDRFALNATYADTAGSVSKLGTENVGNSNKPIYLENGTPKECVDFLPLSAGEDKKLTGPLGLTENVNYGPSLPEDGFIGQLFFLETDGNNQSLPAGGTAGQVLVKNGSTDGDASWKSSSISWVTGTSSGPQPKIFEVIGNAIPAASNSASGIITTGDQAFAGAKTFNSHINSYGKIRSYNSSQLGAEIWTDGEGGNITIYPPSSTGVQSWNIDSYDGDLRFFCYINGTAKTGPHIKSSNLGIYGAVWNDYAEFRTCNEDFKPGQVVCENNDDTLSISTYRLQPGANIVSDTFGFAIGETDNAKCPIAVSGRVLAYTYEPREEFNAGDAVCAGPNGTVSKMTREEIKDYPERIIGTVSAVPDYKIWGSGNVEVNGRIWIKVM